MILLVDSEKRVGEIRFLNTNNRGALSSKVKYHKPKTLERVTHRLILFYPSFLGRYNLHYKQSFFGKFVLINTETINKNQNYLFTLNLNVANPWAQRMNGTKRREFLISEFKYFVTGALQISVIPKHAYILVLKGCKTRVVNMQQRLKGWTWNLEGRY